MTVYRATCADGWVSPYYDTSEEANEALDEHMDVHIKDALNGQVTARFIPYE